MKTVRIIFYIVLYMIYSIDYFKDSETGFYLYLGAIGLNIAYVGLTFEASRHKLFKLFKWQVKLVTPSVAILLIMIWQIERGGWVRPGSHLYDTERFWVFMVATLFTMFNFGIAVKPDVMPEKSDV